MKIDKEIIYVTDEDIEYTEQLILPSGEYFDEAERRNIIRDYKDSFDVVACPGSGKTTVLLAKLIILSRKMPLGNNKGICVLTHTNVAIDEIKNRLGDKSVALFKYPNYFGTIQTFIDKFLAIPFFKQVFNKNIVVIDDEAYQKQIRLIFKNNKYTNISRTIDFMVEKGMYSGSREENFVKFVDNRHLKIIHDELCVVNSNGDNLKYKNYYKELYDIKVNKLLINGFLKYNDAFLLAEGYLKNNTKLKEYFGERFQYVFIDEMQDTKLYQQNIFNDIFNEKTSIIQRFGDLNQDIGNGQQDDCCGWQISKNIKTINSSKRYGNGIASFIGNIRVFRDGNLEGNPNMHSYKPHILVFDENSIENVIGCFQELLEKYNLHNENRNIIKAIGRVGQEGKEGELTIKSYFTDYNKTSKTQNANFKNKLLKNIELGKGIKIFLDDIIDILLSVLRNSKIIYNKSEFINYLIDCHEAEYIKFKSDVYHWYVKLDKKDIHVVECIEKTVKKFLKNIYRDKQIDFKYIDEYFKDKDEITKETYINLSEGEIATTKLQTYIDGNINIQFDTVHGVKGETHTATLYLETKYSTSSNKNLDDIRNILDYMIGKKEEIESVEIKEALSIAYVAMSRAKKLICVACCYDTVKEHIEDLKSFGYVVIGCSSYINQLLENKEL